MLPSLLGCATPVVLRRNLHIAEVLMAWIMFKQTSLRCGWISGRSGLMSSSRHWKGLWRFERGSWKFWPGWLRVKGIWRLEPALGASKHQRFGRVLEGSAGVWKAPEIFLNKKKLWAFGKVFCLRFPSRFPVCPEGFRFGGVQLTNRAHGMSPMTSPGPNKPLVSLGFPQQARRIWDGRSGLPNLGWMDPRQRPMSMMSCFFPQQNDHSYW